MTHAWMNLIAVLTTVFSMGTSDADTVKNVENVEYVAVERISDAGAYIETPSAHVFIEHGNRSGMREGDVIEYRIANDEIENRLSNAHARLERMENTSTLVLNL